MLLLIIIVVIGLVAWALRLMEQAVKSQEFSFMLAGFLVASSAAAMMAVYFLMNDYVLYMGHSVDSLQSNLSISYEMPEAVYPNRFEVSGMAGTVR